MTPATNTLPRTDRGPERLVRRVQREVSPLRAYEVMVILEPGLEEDSIRATLTRATDLVSAQGGTPGRVDRWGKRRFAYEINKGWEGIYVLLEASAEPVAMAELDRMLSLADEVIRHKIIRIPDAVWGQARPAVTVGGGRGDPVDGSTREGDPT